MTNKSRHYYHHHPRYNYNYAPMLLKSCTKHHVGSQNNRVQASWERNSIDHLEIRNLIIQFEEMNRGILETYLLPLTNKPTFEEHLQLLHNPTSWATQTEVLAVATYFRVPVFY